MNKAKQLEPMVVTIRKKKFKMVEVVNEAGDQSQEQTIDEVLKIPAAKPKVKMGGARVPGLPHCILDMKFPAVLKEKEEEGRRRERTT